jgi:hypothetical protein
MSNIIRTSIVCAAVLLNSAPVFGQGASAFVYIAPGAVLQKSGTQASGDGFVHVGGGGGYVFKNGIGIEADGGVISQLFEGTRGAVSIDGGYHFRLHKLVEPFVAGGYSSFFSKTYSPGFFSPVTLPRLNLFNYGGGTNLWFARHVGARVELRDHVHSGDGVTTHYAEFVLGLGIR